MTIVRAGGSLKVFFRLVMVPLCVTLKEENNVNWSNCLITDNCFKTLAPGRVIRRNNYVVNLMTFYCHSLMFKNLEAIYVIIINYYYKFHCQFKNSHSD